MRVVTPAVCFRGCGRVLGRGRNPGRGRYPGRGRVLSRGCCYDLTAAATFSACLAVAVAVLMIML